MLLSISLITAQSSWKKLDLESIAFKSKKTSFIKHMPKEYNMYSLDVEDLKNKLTSQNKGGVKTIMLPNNDDEISEFLIKETSYFTEPLSPKFGFIKSYTIQNRKDKSSTGKISIGTDGVHITIYSGKKPTFYIDPYTKNNRNYISYSRSSLTRKDAEFECRVKENLTNVSSKPNVASKNANDGKLRTFRLALACTGEYAKYHTDIQGVSSETETVRRAAVLSAMNTTMTRVNGLFERDLAVRMNLSLIHI